MTVREKLSEWRINANGKGLRCALVNVAGETDRPDLIGLPGTF